MCDTAMPINPAKIFPNLVRFKTQEMCIEVVEVDPWQLYDVPDHFKVQGMGDKAVREEPSCLQHVPDWFVTQQQKELWNDVDDYCNDDEIIEWYNGYKNPQGSKSKNRRRVNAYCLPTITLVRLAHVRGWEKADRKIVEVTFWCGLVKVSDCLFVSIKLSNIFSSMC